MPKLCPQHLGEALGQVLEAEAGVLMHSVRRGGPRGKPTAEDTCGPARMEPARLWAQGGSGSGLTPREGPGIRDWEHRAAVCPSRWGSLAVAPLERRL